MEERDSGPAGSGGRSRGVRLLILLAVVGLFTAVLLLKATAVDESRRTAATAGPGAGDVYEEYESALDARLPIYILFHSETCAPCVEIDRVADVVVPEYEGRVSFVDAITDDPGARELAARFPFQYIPTSFFLDAGGEVVDSHTGVLTGEQMRARLDGLLE